MDNVESVPNGKELRRRENSKEKDVKIVNDGLTIPRTIGLLGGVSFIVGTIIGSGIFISPRGVALYSGSVGMTLLVWLFCGLLSLLGAFCFAELGTVVKSSGGDYSYLDEAFGSLVSFQYSWIYNVLIKPGSQATLALTFAEYIVTSFFSCGQPPEIIKKLLAASLILFLGSVNMLSVKIASRIQIVFTFTKLTAVALIIGGGIFNLSQGLTDNLETGFKGTNWNLGSIMTSFYSGMWAYDGWNTANFLVEEMVNVERNLPLSIMIGVPSVIVIYVLINVSYFTVLSIDQMTSSVAVAITWAEIVIPKFAWIIPAFVAFSCLGTCNASLFSGGRLIKAAARNNHLPIILSMVHMERFTPVMAILCNVSLGVVIIFIGTISSLIDSLSFVILIFNSFSFAAVIVFRKKAKYKDVPRPIKVPIILPIICLLLSMCLVIMPLVMKPQLGYFFALVFILIGYVIYVPLVHLRHKPKFMDKLTESAQILLKVFKPVQQ